MFHQIVTAARSWRGQVEEAEARVRAGAPAFVYQLDFEHAKHTDDIGLSFGTFENPNPARHAMSDTVMDAFVRFARTGNPGWGAYGLKARCCSTPPAARSATRANGSANCSRGCLTCSRGVEAEIVLVAVFRLCGRARCRWSQQSSGNTGSAADESRRPTCIPIACPSKLASSLACGTCPDSLLRGPLRCSRCLILIPLARNGRG